MKIAIPREYEPKEKRVPVIPQSVANLVKQGAEVIVEQGMGETSLFTDEQYEKAGARISDDRKKIISEADIVLRLRKPPEAEIDWLKQDAIHISYLDPFNETGLIEKFKTQKTSAVSMELIPRTTLAQKMDALSSQASLGGYVAVMLAAERLNKIFPMMMTPAGTLAPSRVFIIGAGVAGLQAIATAKRMGARVEAFDTRTVVKEQVQSLGAKFIEIDLGETGQTEDGYARQLTDEQLEKQRRGMAKVCAQSDVVITTAQVFGRKAPRILTAGMIKDMKPGSIIVDMAAESGGNVEGTQLGKEVEINGITIMGLENLPGRVPVHASQMYSSNLTNLLSHFWDTEAKALKLDLEDEIIQGCLVTHQGEIISNTLKNMQQKV
ncbi:MAG: Re/Si-specific NAD(P)(+) transhydrogenase subunit alpha [Chitinivibrionales bacterium]|nr:Re/Si-specific NAD(P)(+) transhydrogenase subunit alpha [Chitinivibrionales bacterium]